MLHPLGLSGIVYLTKIRINIDILDRHMWNVLLEGKFRLLHTERGI